MVMSCTVENEWQPKLLLPRCYIIATGGVRVRAALLTRGAKPMDTILQVVRALGALSSIARLLLELFERWNRRKHIAEDERQK